MFEIHTSIVLIIATKTRAVVCSEKHQNVNFRVFIRQRIFMNGNVTMKIIKSPYKRLYRVENVGRGSHVLIAWNTRTVLADLKAEKTKNKTAGRDRLYVFRRIFVTFGCISRTISRNSPFSLFSQHVPKFDRRLQRNNNDRYDTRNLSMYYRKSPSANSGCNVFLERSYKYG